jgi:hypothetical protein
MKNKSRQEAGGDAIAKCKLQNANGRGKALNWQGKVLNWRAKSTGQMVRGEW